MISLSTEVLLAPSATAQTLEEKDMLVVIIPTNGSEAVWHRDLHRIGSPQNQQEEGQRAKELGNTRSLGPHHVRAVEGDVPDDDQVRDDGNGEPAPLLSSAMMAHSREQTAEEHDDIREDGHEGVGAVDAGEQAQLEQQEGGGQGPVDIASPVDLAADLVEGVGDAVAVLIANARAAEVVARVARRHGEVRERADDGDERRDDVEDTLRGGHVP